MSQVATELHFGTLSAYQQSVQHIWAQQQLASQWHAAQLAQQSCIVQASLAIPTMPCREPWTKVFAASATHGLTRSSEAAPPGLELHPAMELPSAMQVLQGSHSLDFPSGVLAPPPGLDHPEECVSRRSDALQASVSATEISDTRKAEWRIAQFRSKSRQSAGKALVSQSVCVGQFSDVRLMLYSKFSDERGKKGKAQRAKLSKTDAIGPSDIELRLKAPHVGTKMKFFVSVGSSREGPFECDFTENAIQSLGCFKVNCSMMESDDSDVLVIGLELLEN